MLNVYELSENRVDVRFALHATEKIGSLIPYGKENEPLYCSADGKFHNVQNTSLQSYSSGDRDISEKRRRRTVHRITAKAAKSGLRFPATVYLYGEPKTSTVWASIDLKQRQSF